MPAARSRKPSANASELAVSLARQLDRDPVGRSVGDVDADAGIDAGKEQAALDRAVWIAYGWDKDPPRTADELILERLLALNAARSGAAPAFPPCSPTPGTGRNEGESRLRYDPAARPVTVVIVGASQETLGSTSRRRPSFAKWRRTIRQYSLAVQQILIS
jgi:hypothetical protein